LTGNFDKPIVFKAIYQYVEKFKFLNPEHNAPSIDPQLSKIFEIKEVRTFEPRVYRPSKMSMRVLFF